MIILQTAPITTFSFTAIENQILTLYQEMQILFGSLTSVGQGIAGIGALFYIAYRVWVSFAKNEPIDFLPLMRPFVLAYCIMIFPLIVGLINGILQPIVTATDDVYNEVSTTIKPLQDKRAKLIRDIMDKETPVTDANQSWWERAKGVASSVGTWFTGGFEYVFELIFDWLVTFMFGVARLGILTMRIFNMIVLSIIGPISFGLSVFDGLSKSYIKWISRYISVFLWLPMANIMGAIVTKLLEETLKTSIIGLQTGSLLNHPNYGADVMMIIGIMGYLQIPSMAGWIIETSGANGLSSKMTGMVGAGAGKASSLFSSSSTPPPRDKDK